jgi:hypothetical protein
MTYSDQLITPQVWGPHGWKFIHYVTLGYPENPTPVQKEKYKAFLVLLKDTLPCSLCANHYGENLQKHPLTDDILNSREKLIKWGIDIHNIVNEMKNKPIIRYVDARNQIDTNIPCKPIIKEVIREPESDHVPSSKYIEKQIEKFTEEINQVPNSNIKQKYCSSNNMNVIYGLIGILVALVFIAVIYKKK